LLGTWQILHGDWGCGFSITSDLATKTEVIRRLQASLGAAAGSTFTMCLQRRMVYRYPKNERKRNLTAAAYSGVKTIAAVTTTIVANDTFTVTGVGADPGASALPMPE
jgi:hypothetical protein